MPSSLLMGVLIFGEVGRKVQVLVSVRLLPVHCRSSFLVNFTSKKGILLFSLSFRVKIMLPVGSTVFMCCCNFFAFPVCTRQITHIVSSFSFGNLQVLWLLFSAPGPPCTGS